MSLLIKDDEFLENLIKSGIKAVIICKKHFIINQFTIKISKN